MPDGNGDHEANTSLQGSQVAYFSLAGGSAWKSTSWLSWNAAFRYPRRTFFGHGSRFFGVLAIGDG
jgi:hypothetical protein